MLLTLTELQEMIESSVQEYLQHEYDFLQRANSLNAPHSINPQVWQNFVDMGWLGLPVSEEQGGIGGNAMEAGLLMRAFGQHLVVEPYLNSILLGTRLIAECGDSASHSGLLEALISGQQRVVLAHEEAFDSDPWAPRITRAVNSGEHYRLSGRKVRVVGAACSDALLVSASLEDGEQALFLVPRDSAGLQYMDVRLLDGSRASDLTFNDVSLPLSARLSQQPIAEKLAQVIAEGLISQCWEACGAMQGALQQTTQYTLDRVQFGQPIGKFQVVQHRLAEMAVYCEEAQAACQLASLSVERNPATSIEMALMAKTKIGHGAQYVAKEAVQLHGAMGVSEELVIPSYFRKLLAFTQQYGGSTWFAQRYGALILSSDRWRDSQTLPLVTTA